ncbi:MAG TPA: GNAT family N-acetyltransferase [Solirubrobacterales bacterium]|nr:GNAT family N-acetyltransferase [Solirubrobacterales bacterium]
MTPIVAGDGAALAAAGGLLDRFNREFDEPTPGAEWIAERLPALIEAGDTTVLLAGAGPDGIAVVRFQPSIWSAGDEAYIAELYVVPERRRAGLGAALMTAVLDCCRERRCDYVFLGTDEGDTDAHRLYERFGFTNRSGSELMYVYEREL